MEDLLNLLNKNAKNKKIIDIRQIEFITRRLANIYNTPVTDITYSKDIQLFGFNYFDDSLLFNDVESYRMLKRIYKYNNLDIDFENFANIKYFFYLAHEIRHSYQKNGQDISECLKDIYQKSINYQCYEPEDAYGRLILINRRTIYENEHDLFVVEINADLFAYLFILELIEKSELNNKERYLAYFNKEFKNRFMKSYVIENGLVESKCEVFHSKVVDSLFNKDSLINISEKDRVMNGLNIDIKTLKKINTINDLKSLV